MANLNIDQLIRQINMDGQTRGEFVDYIMISDPAVQALPNDYQRRLAVEQSLSNPNQFRALAGTWLPEYNATHRRDPSWVREQHNNRNRTNYNPQLRNAWSQAAVVGATGLAGIVLGSTIDNEAAQNLVQGVSGFAFAGALVGAGFSYLKYR